VSKGHSLGTFIISFLVFRGTRMDSGKVQWAPQGKGPKEILGLVFLISGKKGKRSSGGGFKEIRGSN